MLAPTREKQPKPAATGRRVDPIVFAVAGLVAAVILVSLVAIPQYLSKQARWDALRSHVGEIAKLAASIASNE